MCKVVIRGQADNRRYPPLFVNDAVPSSHRDRMGTPKHKNTWAPLSRLARLSRL